MGFVEIKRLQELRSPGASTLPGSFVGFEGIFKGTENEFGPYPGGIFDPMGFSKRKSVFDELKLKVGWLSSHGTVLRVALHAVITLLTTRVVPS